MRSAQAGDREAYRALLDDIGPDVRAFLRRTLVDDDDADGAYHDTLLALHRYRHTFKPSRPFEPWLFAIARNVARNHRRQRSVPRSRDVQAAVPPKQATDLDSVSTSEPGRISPPTRAHSGKRSPP